VHYVAGLHGADLLERSLDNSEVVEIIVKPAGAAATRRSRMVDEVDNLVTKRAVAYEDATMEWVEREPRLESDDEGPGDGLTASGPTGEGSRSRSGSVSTKTRREVRHVAPNHHLRDHVEVDLEERRRAGIPRCAR